MLIGRYFTSNVTTPHLSQITEIKIFELQHIFYGDHSQDNFICKKCMLINY